MQSTKTKNPQTFEYMMLSRLQMDCDYFLGNGKGSQRNLHHGNVYDHIEGMKKLWNNLNIKPEWLSYDNIIEYEEKMINFKLN